MKVEDSPLTELVTVLDPDDIKSISLSGLLEVALSNVEDKQVRNASPATLRCSCSTNNGSDSLLFSRGSTVVGRITPKSMFAFIVLPPPYRALVVVRSQRFTATYVNRFSDPAVDCGNLRRAK